jgi:hypothetical protein
MLAGKEGIRFEAQKHDIEPSVEETRILQVRNEGRISSVTEVSSRVEKPAMLETSGEITIHGRDTTIRTVEIRARRLVNDYDGTIKLLPGRTRQTTHSTTMKYGRFLGKAPSQ